MLTSASLRAGIYHRLGPELNINPLEPCFFFPFQLPRLPVVLVTDPLHYYFILNSFWAS